MQDKCKEKLVLAEAPGAQCHDILFFSGLHEYSQEISGIDI